MGQVENKIWQNWKVVLLSGMSGKVSVCGIAPSGRDRFYPSSFQPNGNNQ